MRGQGLMADDPAAVDASHNAVSEQSRLWPRRVGDYMSNGILTISWKGVTHSIDLRRHQ